MRKIIVSATAIILFGCGQNVENTENPNIASNNENTKITSKVVETVVLGESCAEKACKSGLECSPQKVCFDPIANKDLQCPDTKDPVCGEVDGVQNGYLNDCHAERYGAKVLHKGFCKE